MTEKLERDEAFFPILAGKALAEVRNMGKVTLFCVCFLPLLREAIPYNEDGEGDKNTSYDLRHYFDEVEKA